MKQLIGVAVALLLVPCVMSGDIPDIMSYQGVLRDGSGSLVPDGNYVVTFRIYDVEVGGSALWAENQSIMVEGGIINAHLGAVVSLSSLDCDVPYWLGISIGGSEMVPRTALTTVPYAAHAGWADTCLEGDEDWEFAGGDIYRITGGVGIGTGSPSVKLDVLEADAPAARFENTSPAGNFTLRAVNNNGNAGAFFSKRAPNTWPATDAAVFGHGGPGARGAHFISDDGNAVLAAAPNGIAVWGYSTGNYSGYFSGGGYGVYVDDLLRTNEFMLPTGAVTGYVLTSDMYGHGTWQPAAGGADSDWIISGIDMYPGVSGMVGIGTTSPGAKLDVHYGPAAEALNVTHGYWNGGRVANFEWVATPSANSDILQLEAGASAPDNCQFIECERGTAIEFAVNGDGSVISSGKLEAIGSYEVQAEIVSDYASNTAKVVSAITSSSSAYDVIGVYGQSTPTDYYGIGGRFVGGYHGVRGDVNPTGNGYYTGVLGYAGGGNGVNYGVQGTAYSGNVGYGVYGYASANNVNWAGYFNGDVTVTGTLYGGTPAFRIDHPLDPEASYLAHAGVQSDEMVNVYSGNVVLDARGEASVEMPDWFEVLNSDFRYQLTCIGGYAPVYVAETISGGRFVIAGGEPGMTVSWQVTGVRHDPVAVASGFAVEQDKHPHEQGKYMHPEAYGKPETAAVHYFEEREHLKEPAAVEPPTRRSSEFHEDG
jgi:hypothetical protein